MMHRVRQLILVWTRMSMAVSHSITWFQTQLIVTACQIRCHGRLWDQSPTA